MAVMAGAGLAGSQEPGTFSKSLTCVAGAQRLGPSAVIIKELDQKCRSQYLNWLPIWLLAWQVAVLLCHSIRLLVFFLYC